MSFRARARICEVTNVQGLGPKICTLRTSIFRNVQVARRFEYKTREFIMHAKRENKQGENGTAAVCPYHYPRDLIASYYAKRRTGIIRLGARLPERMGFAISARGNDTNDRGRNSTRPRAR